MAVVGPERHRDRLLVLVLVNPRITQLTGKKDKKRESCMSLPHYGAPVERRSKVTVLYQDIAGSEQTLQADAFLARIIQHEVDHLDGILYVDHLRDWALIQPLEISGQENH